MFMNNTMNNEEKKVLQDVHISKNDTCLTGSELVEALR